MFAMDLMGPIGLLSNPTPLQELKYCLHFRLHLMTRLPVTQVDSTVLLAPVVRKVDNSIHRINHYPEDGVVCFVNIYPLDSDLSGG